MLVKEPKQPSHFTKCIRPKFSGFSMFPHPLQVANTLSQPLHWTFLFNMKAGDCLVVQSLRLRLLNGFGKGKGNPLFHFPNIFFFFFQITSITFYYYSNKKNITKQIFFIFLYQTFLLFHFFKKNILTFFFHINQFLLQYRTETETKSFTKQTLII